MCCPLPFYMLYVNKTQHLSSLFQKHMMFEVFLSHENVRNMTDKVCA